MIQPNVDIHMLLFPSWDNIVINQTREGNNLRLHVAINLEHDAFIYVEGQGLPFHRFPAGLALRGDPHISLDYNRLMTWEQFHHWCLEVERLLERRTGTWGALVLSDDQYVLSVGQRSKLFALGTLIQRYMGGHGEHHRRLHISLSE